MDLMSSVTSKTVATGRLTTHYLESGSPAGEPVVFIHGNLATGRFYERTLAAAPDKYRCIAPDMRGFGDSDQQPIDATRGLRDWSDDVCALTTLSRSTRPTISLAGPLVAAPSCNT